MNVCHSVRIGMVGLLALCLPALAGAVMTEAELATAITNGDDPISIDADIVLTAPLPIINQATTINGNGNSISGGGTVRVFHIDGVAVSINDLTIENGFFNGSAGGGGILIEGDSSAALSGCTIRNNVVINGRGGGIHTHGDLILNQCEVSDNRQASTGDEPNDGGGLAVVDGDGTETPTAVILETLFYGNTACDDGGGVNVRDGILNVLRSTFAYNRAGTCPQHNGPGGAISGSASPDISITNSTFFRNRATGAGGGAIRVDSGNVDLVSSTLVGNTSSNNGGALRSETGSFEIINTIIGANSAGSGTDDCSGTFVTDNNNLLVNGRGCPIGASDIGVPAPLGLGLGTLADNGGPTQTILPAPGSPAIDNGDNGPCPGTDQRGVSRAASGGDPCDIGAVEAVVDLIVTKTNDAGGTTTVGTPWNWTVTMALPAGTATFVNTILVLADFLPDTPNLSYGSPSVSTTGTVSGMLACTAAPDVACFAAGNFVMSPGSTVTLSVPITALAPGDYTNPRASEPRICSGDSNNDIAEAFEDNNSCNDDTVIATFVQVGGPCSDDFQCETACVDGVCCNEACDGPFDQCNLEGFEGSCMIDIGNPCSENAECAVACTDGVCCDSTCSGEFEQCDLGGFEGSCRTTIGNPCDDDSMCTVACVHGVCCDSICDGPTELCAVPGSVGMCVDGVPAPAPAASPSGLAIALLLLIACAGVRLARPRR